MTPPDRHDELLDSLWYGGLFVCLAAGVATGFALGFIEVWQSASNRVEGFFVGTLAGIACAIPGVAVGLVLFLPVACLVMATAVVLERRS